MKGKIEIFFILKTSDALLCPLQALKIYFEGAKALGIDLRFGCLFRTLSKNRKEVTENPVTSSAIYYNL